MRDPNKEIPGLSKEAEQAGGFTRVQADVTKPETVTEAIKKSGAKRAFFYLAWGTPDHMKSSIQAMKDAGIDFIVFLSSFTIHPSKVLREIPAEDVIPHMHAQVEASLDDVYGSDNYVAVRPGNFATNLLQHKDGIAKGDVRNYGSHMETDSITPESMGQVSGTILANGPKNGQKKVYLYGPKLRTLREAIGEVGKVLGKDIQVTELNEDEGREKFKQHFPPPIVDYFIRVLKMHDSVPVEDRMPNYEEGVENVKLYTGRPSMSLQDWATQNKELFSA